MRAATTGCLAAVIVLLAMGPAVAKPAEAAQRPDLAGASIEARYQEGLKLERHGDVQAAVDAYRAAADAGHGLAQRKLGDIYGTGKGGIDRDYELSLRWYNRTRDQGIDIPNKPFVFPGVRR